LIALLHVASLPLRADVRLAARQQRIADELREECRQSSGPFVAIALYELQSKWDARNQLRRQVSYQAKEALAAQT
jgi:predicted TIM-barrel fold metal-dependent hydrolase